MDEIIAAIKDGSDIEKQAAVFSSLTKGEKLVVLGQVSNIKSEFSGQFLNAVYPGETDKDVLKVIRKSIFRLKSAGIRVEEPKATGEPVLKKVTETRENKGFMSNYDETGGRIILLVFGIKKNSFILLNAISHYADGLLELSIAPVDKQELEIIINEFRNSTLPQAVFEEVSPRYASLLIEEASGISGRFAEEIKQMKPLNARLTGGVRKTADIYDLAVPEGTGSVSPETVFAHDIFMPLNVTWEGIDSDRKEYAGPGGSTIVLPPYMVEEKRQEFVRTLVSRDPLASYVPRIKRLMEDYAYLFYAMNDLPYYKGLIEYLRDVNAPQETLSRFVAQSLVEETEEEAQDGLIVNPYDTVRP